MIFPLWKFWTYRPTAFVAAFIWNFFELARIPCPFAPWVFGVIMGSKPRKL